MRAVLLAAACCGASGLALPRARTRSPSHVVLRGGKQYTPMPETATSLINLGTAPFPVLSAAIAAGSPRFSRVVLDVLLHYSATILTFISGIWWGCLLKGTPTKSHTGLLVYAIAVALASNAVAVLGASAGPLSARVALGCLAGLFGVQLVAEHVFARALFVEITGGLGSDDKPASALVRMRKWPMVVSVVSLALAAR